MTKPENLLATRGFPLGYAVQLPGAAALTAPVARLGDSTRTVVRSLTVMQKEAIIASANSDRVWRLSSDEGAYLNGYDEAPPPLAYLSAGMVSSYLNEILALAAIRKLDLKSIKLVQDNFYSMNGSLMAGTMVASAHDIAVRAIVQSDEPKEAIRALVYDAIAASPLNGLMAGIKASLFTLSHNGTPINSTGATELGAPPVPALTVDASDMQNGDWSAIVERTGKLTPMNENSTTFAGGALTETQNRILHLRVFAEREPDGTTRIVQHLFNPHGSIFHFTSDEMGRAPSAAALISAGIGFCFMTQIGRYAMMRKQPLKEYQIIQDFHFSKGGASGNTGLAGHADPLETHVHVWSEQPDAFVQKALDVSEQTCFLHAFCRTPLKAKVSLDITPAA
ncbi:OsmC family protein [Oceaniovalibus sp. ACAM 378]|uniref:OsmC family protein n=1 Tax=Oceaniovalibus sp. ACAM 378 TaxID=2599923 RepID=UPI0011D7D318|nr:OsmC family protein [Oceaniovalibus sp. ACAM 378]TYB85169.1 OsmC family protein [Oceaniovalibus sp. ACAM 378]